MRDRVLKALLPGVMLAFLSLSPSVARAQEAKKENQSPEIPTSKQPKPAVFYRVEFVVRELENGKRINSRSYTMLAKEDHPTHIRVGNRVPLITGPAGQFQYSDVGMNIDFTLRELENSLLPMSTKLDSSSVVAPEQMGGGTTNPAFRHVSFDVESEVLPGKPTVIGTLDDVSTNRRYEVEVTATRVK